MSKKKQPSRFVASLFLASIIGAIAFPAFAKADTFHCVMESGHWVCYLQK